MDITWVLASFFVRAISLVALAERAAAQCIPLNALSRASDTEAQGYSNVSSGLRIIDGDIVIDSGSLSRRQAGQAYEELLLWPDKVIPVAFHKSVNATKRALIQSALNYWMEEMCINFREKEPEDTYFVLFRADSAGCTSFVGRQESCYLQGQPVSISAGCDSKHVVAHELGHVVGLYHQHSRTDRDENVHINWENIAKSSQEYFHKVNVTHFDVPYDFLSLMQYNGWHFSKDILNKTTMVTIDPRFQRLLGKATELSFRDKLLLHTMYKCNETCTNLDTTKCLNGGFLKATAAAVAVSNSSGCACQCPPTATGKWCETVLAADYYEALEPLPCGGHVSRDGDVFETPGFPERILPRQSCVWTIKAPVGKVVQLRFEGFEFYPRHQQPGSRTHNKCLQESVELRLNDTFRGAFYCGRDIEPGTVLTSNLSEGVVLVNANDELFGSGLRARVTFLPKEPTTMTTGGPPVMKITSPEELTTTMPSSTRPSSSEATSTTTAASVVSAGTELPSSSSPTVVNRGPLPLDIVINLLGIIRSSLRDIRERFRFTG